MDSDEIEYQLLRDPVPCFIPTCPNDTMKNPQMKFFSIRKELKENWCREVNRLCPKRALYCCEKHLNYEEDLENYQKWLAGAKPRLNINATLKNIPPKATQKPSVRTNSVNNVKVTPCEDAGPSSPAKAVDKFEVFPAKIDASVMAKPRTAEKSTYYRTRTYTTIKKMPSLTSQPFTSEEEASPSPSSFGWSPSRLTKVDSTTSYEYNRDGKDGIKRGREHMLKIIKNKPKMYLGVPKNFWWVIDFLAMECSLLALHIILTLFKIKNNDTFERMSDEFEISRSTLRVLFEKTVLSLATYFQNLIYLPSALEIKKKLPFAFKNRYADVQCIIDCFEIQIEKPSDPLWQGQAWSQYKSCNTLKYLIGCTPAGFITFISKGFSGRISDKAITNKSGLADILPRNAIIMADRGFKEIESLLSFKNVKLLRPPSAYSKTPLTKEQVVETKVIASLRVHIERVIRRVREFRMLKPHSVVNHKHVKYLDEIVVIACGLISLQERIIKED